MREEADPAQEHLWEQLYSRIRATVGQFGVEDRFGEADYLVVDDNYGWERHTVEIHKLNMLQPEIVKLLRDLLEDYPTWEIVVLVDIPGTEDTWPRMGLTIRKHEIIDGLVRQYLPQELQNLKYEDGRPGTGYD